MGRRHEIRGRVLAELALRPWSTREQATSAVPGRFGRLPVANALYRLVTEQIVVRRSDGMLGLAIAHAHETDGLTAPVVLLPDVDGEVSPAPRGDDDA